MMVFHGDESHGIESVKNPLKKQTKDIPRHPGTILPEVFPVFDRYVFGVQSYRTSAGGPGCLLGWVSMEVSITSY